MATDLKLCPHCGKPAGYEGKQKGSRTFWRVVCTGCGCGTWCDGDGYGHMGDTGMTLAALEWNQRNE